MKTSYVTCFFQISYVILSSIYYYCCYTTATILLHYCRHTLLLHYCYTTVTTCSETVIHASEGVMSGELFEYVEKTKKVVIVMMMSSHL